MCRIRWRRRLAHAPAAPPPKVPIRATSLPAMHSMFSWMSPMSQRLGPMPEQCEMSRKRVLVIGGAGFIGSVLCPTLAKLGHSVTVFDKKPRSETTTSLDYIQGDVRDREEVA